MRIREAQDRYRRLAEHLQGSLAEDALPVAFDAIALIKIRIQRRGEDSSGARFAPYTPAYAKYGRTAEGYQAQYVDFTRRGELMKSIRARVIAQGTDRVTVEISPDNVKNQAKVDGAFRKRGNILALSQSERAMALRSFADKRRDRVINFR